MSNPNLPPDGENAPATSRKPFLLLVSVCVFFLLFDLAFHFIGVEKHPYLKWEQWPGFYGLVGFAASVLLVTFSRFVLRPLVKRNEDYYENPSSSPEEKSDA